MPRVPWENDTRWAEEIELSCERDDVLGPRGANPDSEFVWTLRAFEVAEDAGGLGPRRDRKMNEWRVADVPQSRRCPPRLGGTRELRVEVEKTGLAGLSRTELKLLADVARLGGAPSESGAVLLRLREGFPKSREARRAAFYLGRQAEHDGHSAAAVRWYREYLASNRNGPWAQEVRGRLLRVLSRRGETESACAVAHEYLRAHPDGAHAGPARELVAQ